MITSADTKGRAAEGLSIIIDKEVWTSDETFEATLGLWGLSVGRSYTLDWEIRTGNGTDTDQIFHSGTQNFTASAAARQLSITANHIGSESSHIYRLITSLSDNSGTVANAQVNFTSFTNSLPRGYSNIVFFGDSLSDMGNSYGQWGTPDSPPFRRGAA